jgi:hypothetical protein
MHTRIPFTGRNRPVVATPRVRRCGIVFKHQRVAAIREMRGKIWSPGRPSTFRREDRVRFWAAIARGVSTDAAARVAGMSSAVGARWFREAGGVSPCLSPTVSGRYLSFAEREEIATLRSQHCGVRETPDGSAGTPRRSHGSCAATRRRAATN